MDVLERQTVALEDELDEVTTVTPAGTPVCEFIVQFLCMPCADLFPAISIVSFYWIFRNLAYSLPFL